MKKDHVILIKITLTTIAVVVLIGFILSYFDMPILNPFGEIGKKQRDLMIIASILMLVVMIPVYILLFWLAWKYRATNRQASYTPDWDSNRKLEAIWWGIPVIIIAILAVVTWNSSHELDPFKKISSEKTPIKVQVVALQWRWLFIYPDYNIASINEVRFPKNTPVNFEITSDAPMNSFWIPRLGGQVYAMSGMNTQLHLIADRTGTFRGSSANISGEGFSNMRFAAKSMETDTFLQWIADTQAISTPLTSTEYTALAKPAKDTGVHHYSPVDHKLYDKIIMKYMSSPQHGLHEPDKTPTHTNENY